MRLVAGSIAGSGAAISVHITRLGKQRWEGGAGLVT
ncbi:unnamed protein product [Chondrus crispus]|uniref:Uncharacterized protein n=1 Tax=Chondrus crispus TaxID=2769 RepID=R7QL15_CHOCR|nr:unnamed protein product [Chondrus crispus]CDF38176.1 unnamed protein product [Chondrus crispus]|eukprot:XP_005718045.1 unnamed protein product [Chondrus crispus]